MVRRAAVPHYSSMFKISPRTSVKIFFGTLLVLAGAVFWAVSRFSNPADGGVPSSLPVPLISSPTSTSVSKITPISPPPLQWGFYAGWGPEEILELEKTLGKTPNHVAVFIHWGNENQFPMSLSPIIREKGQTLVIFWEATDYTVGTVNQPKFSYDAILRGDWDTYMRSFAADAKSYGGPIILIPFSEMNSDWFPWSGTKNGNTPAKAILAYQHVHDIFSEAPNVKFGWAPNNDSLPNTPENSMDKYYPGDAYVDYVGIDGFNFGNPWQTFDDMFAGPLAILASYHKPIYIFSFASADGPDKANWITNTFTKDMPKYPKIAGWIWFNENKERDWRVNSDPDSFAAFKAILP
jgi:hypothetical protein